jgi:hypothetical protein
VIDWKQSLPTIIAAIIGSGLIVSAFSTISSLILKPGIEIHVGTYQDQFPPGMPAANHGWLAVTHYNISLSNVGYTSATHLRLTMSYPRAEILHTIVGQADENMSIKNESGNQYHYPSVVAFIPRLTHGARVTIETSVFPNDSAYSFVATYDQDTYKYSPEVLSSYVIYNNRDVLEALVLIVLAFLCFAVTIRHRRRSKSKLASDILIDIMNVRNELNNDNGDSSGIILRLHAWQSNTHNEREVVSDYRDYQIIDDFYSAVRSRNCYLLQNQVRSDVLNILNKDCVEKANFANDEIEWRKFHELDLLLLIPSIILVSLFITFIYEGTIANFLFVTGHYSLAFVVATILSGISSFFILRLILRATQGVIVTNYGFPPIFRSHAFWFFCFVIVGIPTGLVPALVLGIVLLMADGSTKDISYISTHLTFIYSFFFQVFISLIILLDIGKMFLLTWVVWRHYMKHKVKRSRHFLFKKQGMK